MSFKDDIIATFFDVCPWWSRTKCDKCSDGKLSECPINILDSINSSVSHTNCIWQVQPTMAFKSLNKGDRFRQNADNNWWFKLIKTDLIKTANGGEFNAVGMADGNHYYISDDAEVYKI